MTGCRRSDDVPVRSGETTAARPEAGRQSDRGLSGMKAALLAIAASLCLAVFGPAAAIADDGPPPLIFAHIFPTGMAQHQAAEAAVRDVGEISQGRVKILIRPNGELGNQDSRLLEAISVGQADMAFVGGAFAASDYGPIGIISGAFNFRDFNHWRHFRDSPLAAELIAGYEAASDLVVLGLCYNGPRHIASRRPLLTPDALAGSRIRVPNAPGYIRLFRAFGAEPVPVPFAETWQQLKSGEVDGEESPLTTIVRMKFYEVAPFISLTGHTVETNMIVMARRSLARYSPQDQALIRRTFAAAASRLSESVAQEEADLASRLTELGAQVTPVDRSQFLTKVRPLLEGDAFPWSGALYDRLQAIR